MERAFLDEINVNVSPYVTVISLDDVYQSIDSIGYPAVLKPIRPGVGRTEPARSITNQTLPMVTTTFKVGLTYWNPGLTTIPSTV